MKKIGLYDQLKLFKGLKVNGIVRKEGGVPTCRKCNKPLDVCEIKERGPDPDRPKWFEIYAKCHGEEDYSRVESETPLPPHMWQTIISTGIFFDPSHTDDSRRR